MVGGLETVETNRRRSLSLALPSLADAAPANATTPLSTLLERKIRHSEGQRDGWKKSSFGCVVNSRLKILSTLKKKIVLQLFKLLCGVVLVYESSPYGWVALWDTPLRYREVP